MGAMMVLIVLYAIGAKEMYGKVPNGDGGYYFDTYSKSLATMFRLFVGEAWHEAQCDSCE